MIYHINPELPKIIGVCLENSQVFCNFAVIIETDQKTMSGKLLNKYVWLVETIHKAGRITLKEVSHRWKQSEMGDGQELSARTFHKWRVAAEELFGLIIDNEGKGEYRYYISNPEVLESGSMGSWVFNNISVSNKLMECRGVKKKVLLEEVSAGREFLDPLLDALKSDRVLRVTYKGFLHNEPCTYELEPYCLRMYHRRWYLVGRSRAHDRVMIYALDCVQSMDLLPEHFRYPSDFDAADFFYDSFGVIIDHSCPVETFRLKVSAHQAYYLRTQRMHRSQVETMCTGQFSLFELRLRPTFDFRQALLSMGEDVEVLSPEWLRENMAAAYRLALRKYDD